MKFIYINKGASPSRFSEYLKKYNNTLQQQGQKYNQLLMEGLVKNGGTVLSISTRPLNRSMERKIFMKKEEERENGIDYHYVSYINLPVFRNLSVFLNVFFKILFTKASRKETVVVCDALNIAASFAALLASRLRRLHASAIVTDVPCHRPSNAKIPTSQKINLWLMQQFDSYLLLTDQMSLVVNPKKRPYVVLEGHADISMRNVENTLENKQPAKICLYAGSLRSIYGIKDLVYGFIAADVPNTELHIYGSGDFKDELCALAKNHPTVKYFGVVPNAEIVRAELEATLLVNPRPTHEDYTKYSFPSKNMEYMASGTPVLTTKLPGMPADHLQHVYLIEEESADGIARTLRNLLTKSSSELHEKGAIAKEFILKEKNNVKQAEKFIKMLNELL